MCVRVSSETVDKIGNRSVLFVDSLNTIGFDCDNWIIRLFNNAFKQKIGFKNATNCPVDTGGACGELLTELFDFIDDFIINFTIQL